MRLIARPIDAWPGEFTGHREPTPFKANWSDTVDLLAREIEHLVTGRDPEVVMQLAITEAECRLDGWVRANARPPHPGVILSFESRHGPLRYHTDRFENRGWSGYLPGWQSNVRAIALGLEALRKVDRYGISKAGEQYRGWNALPPGRAMGAAMTVEDAARLIAHHSDDPEGRTPEVEGDPAFALALFKEAARNVHPDHNGGDGQLMADVNEARELLISTFGGGQ